MKYIINVIALNFFLSFSLTGHTAKALDIALEMEGFQVEYYDASQTGQVRVKGCNQCTKDLYTFDKNVTVTKRGSASSIKQLIEDQWKAKYPTIFLSPKNNRIIQIAY